MHKILDFINIKSKQCFKKWPSTRVWLCASKGHLACGCCMEKILDFIKSQEHALVHKWKGRSNLLRFRMSGGRERGIHVYIITSGKNIWKSWQLEGATITPTHIIHHNMYTCAYAVLQEIHMSCALSFIVKNLLMENQTSLLDPTELNIYRNRVVWKLDFICTNEGSSVSVIQWNYKESTNCQ